MYVEVPTNVSAIELINSPDTPKSQILIWPLELKRIFDGLMSINLEFRVSISVCILFNSGQNIAFYEEMGTLKVFVLTTMNDSMNII